MAVQKLKPVQTSANATSKSLVLNALTGYLATFAGMLTGLLMTPVLLHNLGPTRYGLWVLLNSAMGYIGLAELGIGTAVAKRVAECLAVDDRKRLDRILGTAFVLYVLISIVVLVITLMLTLFAGKFFHIPSHDIPIAQACLFVLGISQVLNFLFTSQSAILFGSGRIYLITRWSVAISVISSLGQMLVVLLGLGIVALAWLTVGTIIASGLIGYVTINKNLRDVTIKPFRSSITVAHELLKSGSRNSIVAILGTVAFYSDALIIGVLLPVSQVAVYVVASKMVGFIRSVAQKPIDVTMPSYAHAEATGDRQRQYKLFKDSTLLTLGIVLPLFIVIAAFGRKIIYLWIGAGHDDSYPILVVLALALVLQLPGHACFSYLTALERQGFLIKVGSISAVINLTLTIYLITMYGPIGAAYGTLLVVAISDFIILPNYVVRVFGHTYAQYAGALMKALMLPAVISGTLALFFVTYTHVSSGIGTASLGLAVMMIFWTIFLTVGPGRNSNYVGRLMKLVAR